jgi:antitoxin (DNA-binding transcriptional repressor) of toxin-antitoxin stability system
MDTVQHVRKTDLARNTSKVIRDVLRGQIAIVESHGQPEVAIIDIIDYRLQRAFINFHAQSASVRENVDFTYQTPTRINDDQERYNRILAEYLAKTISLSRAAELLNLPVLDLRLRFIRLGIPLRQGVETIQGLEEDIHNAQSIMK